MLRIAQQNPHLVQFEMLKSSLENPAAWVRDQAHVVAASLAGSVVASPIATEMAYNFGSGLLIHRLPAYLKISRQLGSLSVAVLSFAGTVLLVAQCAFFGLSGPALIRLLGHFSSSELASESSTQAILLQLHEVVWSSPALRWAVDGIAVLTTLYCVVRSVSSSWYILPVIGVASIVVPSLLVELWLNWSNVGAPQLIGILLAFAICNIPFYFLLAIIGTIIWIGCSIVFGGVLSLWGRDSAIMHRTITAAWEGSELSKELTKSAKYLGVLVGIFTGLALVVNLVKSPRGWLVLLACGILIVAACLRRFKGRFQGSRYVAWPVFQVVLWVFWPLCTLLGVVLAILRSIVGVAVDDWSRQGLMFYVIIVAVAIFLSEFAVAYRSVFALLRNRIQRIRRNRIDPSQWAERVRQADPYEQAQLLQFATPERLGLDVDRLLGILTDVESSVQRDPALSLYQIRMSELIDLRRQQRTD
jgi:hypothetical protein